MTINAIIMPSYTTVSGVALRRVALVNYRITFIDLAHEIINSNSVNSARLGNGINHR